MNISYFWKTEDPGVGLLPSLQGRGRGRFYSPSTKSSHCFDEPFSPNTF